MRLKRRARRGRIARITLKTGDNSTRVVILGAGPAGLTAAYELSNLGVGCVVLEQEAVLGGLAPPRGIQRVSLGLRGLPLFPQHFFVVQILRAASPAPPPP